MSLEEAGLPKIDIGGYARALVRKVTRKGRRSPVTKAYDNPAPFGRKSWTLDGLALEGVIGPI